MDKGVLLCCQNRSIFLPSVKSEKMAKRVKIGITIGDKNGIGPEVILKSLQDPRILSGITPIIYGCGNVINHYIKTLYFLIQQPHLQFFGENGTYPCQIGFRTIFILS